MRISRGLFAAVLVSAFCIAASASASAASTSCNAGGSIKLSPGLTSEPQVQNVTIKGTLAGCESNESKAKSGKFNAHFKTAEAISCEALTNGGVGAAAEENKIILKLKPAKHMGNSQGTFSVNVTEGSGELLSGLVESGPFAEDSISGSVTETYSGGHHCGTPVEGEKKPKKVKQGTFVGTLSLS